MMQVQLSAIPSQAKRMRGDRSLRTGSHSTLRSALHSTLRSGSHSTLYPALPSTLRSNFQTSLLALGVALIGIGLSPTDSWGEGTPLFHAFLTPSLVCDVFVGDPVELHFEVDETAQQFNGYEVTIQYDPDILTFVGISEGSLVTDACPQNFENLVFTDSTVTYTHVVLCAGVSLDGPGRLSTFEFATVAPGITDVEITSDSDRTFLDAGIYVSPAHPTFPRQVTFDDAIVIVLDPTAEVPLAEGGGSVLHTRPHPVRGPSQILFSSPLEAKVSLELIDVRGRRIWSQTLPVGMQPRIIPFPSESRDGETLRDGVYFLAAQQPGEARRVERIVVMND